MSSSVISEPIIQVLFSRLLFSPKFSLLWVSIWDEECCRKVHQVTGFQFVICQVSKNDVPVIFGKFRKKLTLPELTCCDQCSSVIQSAEMFLLRYWSKRCWKDIMKWQPSPIDPAGLMKPPLLAREMRLLEVSLGKGTIKRMHPNSHDGSIQICTSKITGTNSSGLMSRDQGQERE